MSKFAQKMNYLYSRIDSKSCTEKVFTESTHNGSKSRTIFAVLLLAFIWTVMVGISGFYVGKHPTTKHPPQIERKWALTGNLNMHSY